MKGAPVPVVARLLGHRDALLTMRYAHVGDRDVIEAAERVGEAISLALDGPDRAKPHSAVSDPAASGAPFGPLRSRCRQDLGIVSARH